MLTISSVNIHKNFEPIYKPIFLLGQSSQQVIINYAKRIGWRISKVTDFLGILYNTSYG